jgi:excisionase family DNA binding protein
VNDLSARHLQVMLDRHERWCRAEGVEVPVEVRLLVAVVTGRQGASTGDGAGDLPDDLLVPLAYDYPAAGRLLGGVSESTVFRLVKAGEIRSTRVGTRRVIAREELLRYLGRALDDEAPTVAQEGA